MLDRAVQGIEFFGLSDLARDYFERIAANQKISRLGVFFEFMGELSRCSNYRLLSDARLQGSEDEKSMAQTDMVVKYISEHFSEPLLMPALANRFHMSESHFSRVFRRGTGNSFTDFLIRVRITKACQLLMQSDESISTICYDVGFNNVANFNRRFLNVKGMTPSEYREQTRSQFA